MKRQIKFRAWDTQLKSFSYSGFGGKTFMLFVKRVNCPRYIISQYTGLKDKNGKEIYEGDCVIAQLYGVIKYDMKCIIEFENGCFGIRALNDEALVNSKDKFKSFENCNTEKNIEIIGNIYENPELLK